MDINHAIAPHISQRKIEPCVYPITCAFPFHKHSNVALVSKNGPALEATRSNKKAKGYYKTLTIFSKIITK